MDTVHVLMSTYNGEKYLAKQIDSILSQKKINVELYIRDDGSTDSTKEVINAYIKSDSRVHLYAGKNLGVKQSFLRLIQMAPSNAGYYALSDQDDYWMEEKLFEAVQKIKENHQPGIPMLYYSHTTLVDENLSALNKPNPYNKDKPYTFGQIMIKNCASGCTMVFNKKLKEYLCQQDVSQLLPNPLHDHWIYMVCRAIGGDIVFDDRSYILYRQHSGNNVGAKRNLYEKIRTSPLFRGGNIRYFWAKQLYEQNRKNITKDNCHLLYKIINYQKSFRNTLMLAFDNEIKPPETIEKIIVALTILRRGF